MDQNRTERYIFLAVFLLLLLGMFFGLDPQNFSSRELPGTIFYFLLLLGSLIGAGYSQVFEFNNQKRAVFRCHTFFSFGITEKQKVLDFEQVTDILIQEIHLLKDGTMRRDRHTRVAKYIEQRTRTYKIFLESFERRILLEEGSQFNEIEFLAKGIGGYLHIPVRQEKYS